MTHGNKQDETSLYRSSIVKKKKKRDLLERARGSKEFLICLFVVLYTF